jgi:hypothetical protein
MLIPLIDMAEIDPVMDLWRVGVEFAKTNAEWILIGCLFVLFSDYYPPIRMRLAQTLHWMIQLAFIISTWKFVHFMYMLATDLHQCI